MSEQQPPSRAVEICNLLARNIRDGRLSLQIAVLFHEATTTGPLLSKRWLYAGIRFACWRDALMSLSRLIEDDRCAVTLTYLLNHAEQNKGEYRLATAKVLGDEVARQKVRLAAVPLRETVKRLRDKTLAHTDKDHLGDPPSVQFDPIAVNEVEQAFTLALSVVNALRHLVDGMDMGRTPINVEVQREFERLLAPHDRARAEEVARREEWRRTVNLPSEGEEEE